MYKHGENQALNVSQQVVFRDVVRDGSGNITSQDVIPLQRNHLYKVVLTPKYNLGALEFEKIDYAIQVVDWQNGETVKFTGDANLTHQSRPNFTVTNAIAISGTEADGVTNPTLVCAGIDDHSIYLTVTSETTGTMLESTTFPSTQYGLVSSATTNDGNGNLVETYKIDIDDNIAMVAEYTFTLSNAINTSLSRTFVLKKRPKLPLEYMAVGNIRSLTQTDGYWIIDNEVNAYSSAFFNWSTASANFGTDDGTGFNRFNALCSYTDPDTGVTTTGNYHMPTINEWYGILPSSGVQVFRVSQNTNTTESNELKTVIGQNVLQGYSSQFYRTWSTSYDDVTYALRFINDPIYGNSYRCAYRYQFFFPSTTPQGKLGRYVVSCIYVGDDPSITSVNDVKAAFWANTNGKEVITRTIPCTSSSPNGQANTGSGSGSGYNPPYNTSYRSSTSATQGFACPVGPTLYIVSSYPYLTASSGNSVRLFSNN